VQDPNHAVQLFDSAESRLDAVFGFLRDGLLGGDHVLIVATAHTWDALARRCHDDGVDIAAAHTAGWLTVRDANEVLALFMEGDRPDWDVFNASVGALVRSLSRGGVRLRIYGEMVDLLVRANEFTAAECLEQFWNRLGHQHRFQLFCGYSAEHFGNPRDRAALQRICQLHTHVQSDPRDVLGNFLLKAPSAC
jgi:hypothetical protein